MSYECWILSVWNNAFLERVFLKIRRGSENALEVELQKSAARKIMNKIQFVVRYTSENTMVCLSFDGYKDAFDYFSRKQSEGESPALYRETTEVIREVLLRT